MNGSMVHCVRPEGTPGAGDLWYLPLDELAVVRQVGEPIFHALQLPAHLHPGKVDCIYIDPPNNADARDWT